VFFKITRSTVNLFIVVILSSYGIDRSPALSQPIGDRTGETCRTIEIARETDLHLYSRPIAVESDETESIPVFSGEQIHLVRANVSGVDGDDRTWHEIVDSIGNRGYILAFDPTTGLSTLRYCL